MATIESGEQRVCQICFLASDHKPKPTLTPESAAAVDPRTKKKTCGQCRQEWISMKVCKDPSTSKWVHVRDNLQRNVSFCRFIKRGKTCPNGQKCTFAHNQAEVDRYSATPSMPSVNRAKSSSQSYRSSGTTVHVTRKLPTLSFRVKEYKICKHIQSNRRCVHGEFCTFAHSQSELHEWNQSLISDHDASNARDTEGLVNTIRRSESDSLDANSKLRSTLVSMYKQGVKIHGMLDTYKKVTIKEREKNRVNDQDIYEWTFEIYVAAAQTLTSVVLFDTLSFDFQISSITLVSSDEKQKTIIEELTDRFECRLNQKIDPSEKILVKITLKTHPGTLSQLVLFEFQSTFRHFFLVRRMSLYIPSDLEKRLFATPKKRATQDLDLHWELHYKEIPMEADLYSEETDVQLKEYAIPENLVHSQIKDDEGGLTKDNYRERMHHLLYLEEHEHKKIMSRYDLYDVVIKPETSYEEQLRSGMTYAPEGHFFVTLSLEEELFEGTNSIRSGDSARILIQSKNEVHHCIVEHVGREHVVLHITERTKVACSENGNHCSIRFVPSRLPLKAMHFAIDHVDLDKIFPTVDSKTTAMSNPTAIKKCQRELKKLNLNHLQQEVISTVITPELTGIPTLVLGPFGVGKTHTLCDCIKLITWNFLDSHILVCTHSNSAANLYVSDIHSEWAKRGSQPPSMLRLYFTKRRIQTIRPPLILNYCKMENEQLIIPTLDEIQEYRIVVTTLVTSRTLSLLGLRPGHFSHIIIDEAAQALEPETIIPMCLADKDTKIVLAGDHLQLMPSTYSSVAKQHDFHVTLLERLHDCDVYDTNNVSLAQCRTLLTINYRSRQEILEIPSRLFYKTELVSNMSPLKKHKSMHAVRFIGVNGQECRDQDSPSYYNDQEAAEVCKQVKLLVKNGLKPEEICTLAYDQMQVIRLRRFLRREKFSLVKVFRVDDVQGEEFQALIISTVRTCIKEPPAEEDGGFLTDPRLLNTAITRAREWLIVIGEPVTLCTVGLNRVCWMEFIKYCCQCKSFEYPPIDSEQFENSLENKLVLRNLLEEEYENIMEGKISHVKESPSEKVAEHIEQGLEDNVNVAGKQSSFNTVVTKQVVNVPVGDKGLAPVSNDKQSDKNLKEGLSMKPTMSDMAVKTPDTNSSATISPQSQPQGTPERSSNVLQENSYSSQQSNVLHHAKHPLVKTTGREATSHSSVSIPATYYNYQPTQQQQLNRNIRASDAGQIFGSSGASHLSAIARPFIPVQMQRPMGPTPAHNYPGVYDSNPIFRGNIGGQISAFNPSQQIPIQSQRQPVPVLDQYAIGHAKHDHSVPRLAASPYGLQPAPAIAHAKHDHSVPGLATSPYGLQPAPAIAHAKHDHSVPRLATSPYGLQPAPGPLLHESPLYSNPSPPRFSEPYQYAAQVPHLSNDQSSTIGSVSDIDSSYTETEEILLDSDEPKITMIDDIIVYTEDLIGEGAFGYVFKGKLNNKPCAVKVLNAIGTEFLTDLPTGRAVQSNALKKFKMECDYLEKLQHKNIVSHLATRTMKRRKAEIPVLVMELLQCNLRNYLEKHPQIKRFVQVSLSVDVASALEFLHHEDRKLVHRDLCGDNILLSLEGPFPIAKVSDFGMSRIIDFETMSRSLTGLGHRDGYLPREASRRSSSDSYDSSLDIFMFGAVMTQIAAIIPHIESEKQRRALIARISPDHPLKDFIDSCLQEQHARPTASVVRIQLSKRLQDLVN